LEKISTIFGIITIDLSNL